jgi:hypothetical protein
MEGRAAMEDTESCTAERVAWVGTLRVPPMAGMEAAAATAVSGLLAQTTRMPTEAGEEQGGDPSTVQEALAVAAAMPNRGMISAALAVPEGSRPGPASLGVVDRGGTVDP